MWEAGQNNFSNSHPMIETLESRELMSATVHTAAAQAPAPSHAIVMSAKAETKAQTKAEAKAQKTVKVTAAAKPTKAAKVTSVPTSVSTLPTYIPAANPNMAPDITGDWTGTTTLDGNTTSTPFTANFAFQHGIAASGTLDMGPVAGNGPLVTTLVFGANHNFRILILNSSLWMGFTGALTANGQMLYGRFAVNTPSGWETGSFTLNRN